MLIAAVLGVSLALLELHGPDGQVTYVNEREISALRQPTKSDLTHYFPKRIACIVTTTNGKFIAAVETCSDIRDRLTRTTP